MTTLRSKQWVGGTLLALVMAGTPAAAQTTTIDFEADTPGPLPNSFFSVQSDKVSFSDSVGADLGISTYDESNGTRGLGVGGRDTSGLVLNFSVIVNALSLSFGNDNDFNSNTARLRVFRDGTEVGVRRLTVNGDDLGNQTIGISGVSFNRAIFDYTHLVGGIETEGNQEEIVDNIVFTEGEATVPEPGSLVLFLAALAGLWVTRRRRPSSPQP